MNFEEKNPLIEDLTNFLEKVAETQGLYHQIFAHLNDYKEIIRERLKSRDYQGPLLGTKLVMGDLTGVLDNGWKTTFSTRFGYYLQVENWEEKIDHLIRREGMRNISYSYEVLESYLYDIIATYIYNNSIRMSKSKIIIASNIDELRKELKVKYRTNKDLVILMRDISASFSNAEVNNNLGINLKCWFEIITEIRHAITHGNYQIKKFRKDRFLKKEHIEYMESNLGIKFKNEDFPINFSKSQSEQIISELAEYGFLIFKCLSIEANYVWKIFPGMDRQKV